MGMGWALVGGEQFHQTITHLYILLVLLLFYLISIIINLFFSHHTSFSLIFFPPILLLIPLGAGRNKQVDVCCLIAGWGYNMTLLLCPRKKEHSLSSCS